MDRCRTSLQRKLALGTVVLVVAPMFVCALWLSHIAGSEMHRSHARNVAIVSQALASSLAGRITQGWTSSAGNVLDGLAFDPRLAFVIVTDAYGNVWQRRAVDAEGWADYERWVAKSGRGLLTELDGPVNLNAVGDLVLSKLPIWNPPRRGSHANPNGGTQPRQLEGFLIVALRERGLTQTVAQLHASQWIATCVICLLTVPLVIWTARRWTAPLRSLLGAIVRLGAGEDAAPVRVKSRDELGQLAEAFNNMSANLSSARSELQSANEGLEHKVRTRTAELERLNELLESQIQEKNEFFRAVTHDLRAPLRNISGLAAMLLMKYRAQLAGDALAKLERIEANVQAQSGLINDLLELSRLRTNSGTRQTVDLQDLVERLAEGFSYDFECNGITFKILRRLPTIVAEHNRMRQIFQNLLDNAVKYITESPPHCITVDFQAQKQWMHFSVTDTGQGIAPEDRSHVFEVFRRGRSSVTQSVPGRGVGLASAKAIVECYGGRIWVDSKLGQGSTFHFTLDRQQVDVHDPNRVPPPPLTAAERVQCEGKGGSSRPFGIFSGRCRATS